MAIKTEKATLGDILPGLVANAVLSQCDGTAYSVGFDGVRLPELFDKDVKTFAECVYNYIRNQLEREGYLP